MHVIKKQRLQAPIYVLRFNVVTFFDSQPIQQVRILGTRTAWSFRALIFFIVIFRLEYRPWML
ncbi:hypothetical protein AFK24_00595 [Pseudomonas syringae]|uniref:Uncharacterized protein n=1 Tax=Pseudomonas syringae TaxID=317 RepID=A0A1C7ZF72_PSESX|nr:hypothetical protein [Pseudomonas syringae]OCR27025.1 hypothetical protein AFK24_00595 [Pseudomonas syringae]